MPEPLRDIGAAALAQHLVPFREHLRAGGCPAAIVTNYAPDVLPLTLVRDLFEAFDIRTAASDPVRHLVDRLSDRRARAGARRWLPPGLSLSRAIECLEALDVAEERELTDEDWRFVASLYFALVYEESR